MPAESEKQRRYMAAAYSRKQRGESLVGDPQMSSSQLHDFMSKPKGGFAGVKKKG